MNPRPDIETVINEHAAVLMAIAGVTGVANGARDGEPYVVIYVVTLNDALRTQLPSSIDGYPVRIEESGPLGPL